MLHRPLVGRLAAAVALASAAPAGAADMLDLSTYSVSLQRDIDFSEASGVTYNYDKNVLFVVDDEGDDLAEFTLGGDKLTADTIRNVDEQTGGYRDIEGVAYVGGGRYVLAEERTEEMVLIAPVSTDNSGPLPSTRYTDKPDAPKYAVRGGGDVGNNGLEGVAYDPLTDTFFGVRQGGGGGISQAVYQVDVEFGFPSTGSTTQPFDPAPLGLATLSDIATLSSNPNFIGTGFEENLLILSAASSTKRLLEVRRTGELLSSFDLSSLNIDVIEGLALDHAGNIYLVGELGGSPAGLVVLTRNVAPVPEPATWAMMIAGFGLVGSAMRRRGAGAPLTA